MTGERERRVIILAAMFGLLVWALRLLPAPSLPSPTGRVEETSRVELARDMEVYEMSMTQGSDYSFQVFRDVQRICRIDAVDTTITRACALFETAVRRDSDHHAIDDAVQLLREG